MAQGFVDDAEAAEVEIKNGEAVISVAAQAAGGVLDQLDQERSVGETGELIFQQAAAGLSFDPLPLREVFTGGDHADHGTGPVVNHVGAKLYRKCFTVGPGVPGAAQPGPGRYLGIGRLAPVCGNPKHPGRLSHQILAFIAMEGSVRRIGIDDVAFGVLDGDPERQCVNYVSEVCVCQRRDRRG